MKLNMTCGIYWMKKTPPPRFRPFEIAGRAMMSSSPESLMMTHFKKQRNANYSSFSVYLSEWHKKWFVRLRNFGCAIMHCIVISKSIVIFFLVFGPFISPCQRVGQASNGRRALWTFYGMCIPLPLWFWCFNNRHWNSSLDAFWWSVFLKLARKT